MSRAVRLSEGIFNAGYLGAALVFGVLLLLGGAGNAARVLAGVMALVLVGGDAFHLVPRILVARTGREESLRRMLGRGKQISSITMTVFYLLLWQIGQILFPAENRLLWAVLLYLLAAARVFLCLLPQNKWEERHPPKRWGIYRNLPFLLQGAIVFGLYFSQRNAEPGLGMLWLAIALSFGFYLPVVVWVDRNPKIGMLMLPKSCAYLWMLAMFLSL